MLGFFESAGVGILTGDGMEQPSWNQMKPPNLTEVLHLLGVP